MTLRRRKRAASLVLSAFLLNGCAAGLQSTEPAIPPDARAVILANKGRLWKDADSIKNASIALPTRHLGFMWHVCVRLNTKNGFGGYVGERENLIAIYDDGKPPAVLMENAAINCDPQPHAPFPELNGKKA